MFLAAQSAWSAPQATQVDASLNLPVLFVSVNGGGVGNVRLSISSRPTESLMVSITENEPHGVGDQMRAAVWLAAVTASLERRTFLDELRIDAEIHGRVDGPSAGAALTLGLMLLLDGEDWPRDTAITGTVLPDGSIGVVGGVLSKLEGAQKHGLKRVLLPGGLRSEANAEGNQVDLQQRCKELKLRCESVGSINEAYATLLGREAPNTSVSKIRLDPVFEKALVKDYTASRNRLVRFEPPNYDIAKMVQEALNRSEANYTQGNIVGAAVEVMGTDWFLTMLGLTSGVTRESGVSTTPENQPTTSLARSDAEVAVMLCALEPLFDEVGDVDRERLQGAATAAIKSYHSSTVSIMEQESTNLPSSAYLLVNGVKASTAAWVENVVEPLASARGQSASVFLDSIDDQNINYSRCVASSTLPLVPADAALWTPSEAGSVVRAMVGMWGLVVQRDIGFRSGGELDGTTYQRDFILQQMLDRARLRAAQEIGACQQTGRSCRRAVFEFHSANGYRSGQSADPMASLTGYWSASIIALLEQSE